MMKRIRRAAVLVLIIMVLPAMAYTEQWAHVYSRSDEDNYIDTGSVMVQGSNIYYWKKTSLLAPTNPYKRIYGNEASMVYTYVREDCHLHLVKILRFRLCSADGRVLVKTETPEDLSPLPILPNSVAEKTHEKICGHLSSGE